MKRLDLYKLVTRILLAWALLSAAGMLWGRYAVAVLMPFLSVVTDAVSDFYTPILEYRSLPDGDQLFMTAYVTQPTYVHNALTLNFGAMMTVGIDALHVLAPLVILFSTLLAWPIRSWRERALLVASGLPATFIEGAQGKGSEERRPLRRRRTAWFAGVCSGSAGAGKIEGYDPASSHGGSGGALR